MVHQYREKVQQLCSDKASQAEQQHGQNIRAKLINFLEKSEHYVPEVVLVHFPFDSMYYFILFELIIVFLCYSGMYQTTVSKQVRIFSGRNKCRREDRCRLLIKYYS